MSFVLFIRQSAALVIYLVNDLLWFSAIAENCL